MGPVPEIRGTGARQIPAERHSGEYRRNATGNLENVLSILNLKISNLKLFSYGRKIE